MTWERYGNEQRAEGIAEGERIGEERGRLETARNLFSLNLTNEQIAAATGLPLETIRELQPTLAK
mgnify:FL=1